MSIENLAAQLDALDAADAFVSEGAESITVSNLSVGAAAEIASLAEPLGWELHAYDRADSEWSTDALDEEFGPFRLVLDKPPSPEGVLRLLTNIGFAEWLGRDDPRMHWQIGRLGCDIITQSVSFTPWDRQAAAPVIDVSQRSPRSLVREFSGERVVPADLRRWLLRGTDQISIDDPSVAVWTEVASRKLMLSLPDEFDGEERIMRFKGPPRLSLRLPDVDEKVAPALGNNGFVDLQAALAWVFEIERETEMRHILLATELARCSGSGDTAVEFLRDNLASALEGAKTAYQVQLAGMSSDALKTLAELRKSVSDETSKITEATRQIITAVAGSLAVGAGLIAVRLNTAVSPLLILLVMVIAGAYVAITILSGLMFTILQRRVRKEWQPRLYRFLSKTDYDVLVTRPARTAERTLWWCSGLATIAIVVMALVIVQLRPEAL